MEWFLHIDVTGRFDSIDSAVILSSTRKANDDSWTYVVETFSNKNYSDFIFSF